MRAQISVWSKRAIVSPLCAFLLASNALASDDTVKSKPQGEASKSLEQILQQAGEAGLLNMGNDKEIPEAHEGTKVPHADPIEPSTAVVAKDLNCQASEVLDLWNFSDVDSFDDVMRAKSNLGSYDAAHDVIPVAQQFISLGLGTEAVASLSSFETPETNLLSSLGRIIDGVSLPADVDLIRSYRSCSRRSEFWALTAESALTEKSAADSAWAFSGKHRKMLTELPVKLNAVLTVQVGIHAAELGLQTIAETFLSEIEPRSRFGTPPKYQSDERLYFFAVVMALKEETNSKAIFKYLAEKDGIYQVRALLKLVSSDTGEKKSKSDDLLENLLSVQQQYRGKSSSRKASLEIVKKQAAERHYTYAIDLAKREFLDTHNERDLAVNNIGNQLHTDMKLEDASPKLAALNGYLYDPSFFSGYDKLALLQYIAHKAAVDLNFPEVAAKVIQTALLDPEDAAGLAKDIVLTDVQQAYKDGDYARVMTLGSPNVEDKRFRDIVLRASLKQGVNADTSALESALGADVDVLAYQAEIAGQRSDWRKAQLALSSLKDLQEDNFDQGQTLAIVDYVAVDAQEARKNRRLNDISDVEKLQQNLGTDLSLVKAFLTNG